MVDHPARVRAAQDYASAPKCDCDADVAAVSEAALVRETAFLNAAAENDEEVSCEQALVESEMLNIYTPNTVTYNFLSTEHSLLELGAYQLAVCEVMRAVTDIFNEGKQLFSFEESESSPNVECNSQIAYKYDTGTTIATIDDGETISFDLDLGWRATAGLLPDDVVACGWLIEHSHRSLDLVSLIEQLLELASLGGNRKWKVRGDAANFEEKIKDLNEEDKEHVREHLGKYFR